jgi:hypothetical protein
MRYEHVAADNQTHLVPKSEVGLHNLICPCSCATREYDLGWVVIVTHEPFKQAVS